MGACGARWSANYLVPRVFAAVLRTLLLPFAVEPKLARAALRFDIDSELDLVPRAGVDSELLPTHLNWRLGLPSSHWFTWRAKRREQSVSKYDSGVGEMLTIMSVLPSPESAG